MNTEIMQTIETKLNKILAASGPAPPTSEAADPSKLWNVGSLQDIAQGVARRRAGIQPSGLTAPRQPNQT